MNEFIFNYRDIIRLSLAGFLFVAFFLLVINRTFKSVYEKVTGYIDKLNHFGRTHIRGKRYVQDFVPLKFTRMLDETYKYSRIYKTPLGKWFTTSMALFTATSLVSVVTGIVTVVIFKDFSFLYLIPAIFGTVYLILYIMRVSNGHKVTEQLVVFLNLLGNFSTTNTEVISVFAQTAKHVSEPLSSCLFECVAEASGDISPERALINLSNKIEPMKFKEIIKSIIIAQRYSDSFSQTVNGAREALNGHIRQIKDKRAVVMTNLFALLACFVGLIGAALLSAKLLDIDIIYQITHTFSGGVVAVTAIAVLLFFGTQIIGAYKE